MWGPLQKFGILSCSIEKHGDDGQGKFEDTKGVIRRRKSKIPKG